MAERDLVRGSDRPPRFPPDSSGCLCSVSLLDDIPSKYYMTAGTAFRKTINLLNDYIRS